MNDYFTRRESELLCQSYQHLLWKKFTVPKSGIEYTVNFIVPVPASVDEMEEFMDLLSGYLQTGGREELLKFDDRIRKDEFTPVLYGRCDLKGDAILLSVPQRSFVNQEGQPKNGFEVYPGYWLY